MLRPISGLHSDIFYPIQCANGDIFRPFRQVSTQIADSYEVDDQKDHRRTELYQFYLADNCIRCFRHFSVAFAGFPKPVAI